MDLIPQPIICAIFDYTSIASWKYINRVCKKWNVIIKSMKTLDKLEQAFDKYSGLKQWEITNSLKNNFRKRNFSLPCDFGFYEKLDFIPSNVLTCSKCPFIIFPHHPEAFREYYSIIECWKFVSNSLSKCAELIISKSNPESEASNPIIDHLDWLIEGKRFVHIEIVQNDNVVFKNQIRYSIIDIDQNGKLEIRVQQSFKCPQIPIGTLSFNHQVLGQPFKSYIFSCQPLLKMFTISLLHNNMKYWIHPNMILSKDLMRKPLVPRDCKAFSESILDHCYLFDQKLGKITIYSMNTKTFHISTKEYSIKVPNETITIFDDLIGTLDSNGKPLFFFIYATDKHSTIQQIDNPLNTFNFRKIQDIYKDTIVWTFNHLIVNRVRYLQFMNMPDGRSIFIDLIDLPGRSDIITLSQNAIYNVTSGTFMF